MSQQQFLNNETRFNGFAALLSLTPSPPPVSAMSDVLNDSFIPKLYPHRLILCFLRNFACEAFRRLTSVQRSTALLFAAKRAQKAAGGKPNTLSVEDELERLAVMAMDAKTLCYESHPVAGETKMSSYEKGSIQEAVQKPFDDLLRRMRNSRKRTLNRGGKVYH